MLEQSVFAKHREQFMAAMGPNSVALIGSPPERIRNGDAHYGYRQSSNLNYLTGFAEPEATVVLRTGGENAYTLFVRPKDPEREVWDGHRAGIDGACADFGADQAFASGELFKKLKKLIANVDDLYYELGVNRAFDAQVLRVIAALRRGERQGLLPPKRIVDPRWTLHEQRLRKDEAEVSVLREAATTSVNAHLAAMKAAKPGMLEYELEALINYEFRRSGGTGPGYTTIVGGGKNATTLHYIENDSPLKDGDLVLIDAGCERDFYTADITRTFPINGTFSPAQKRCYEVVLDAMTQAIEMTGPGVTLDQIHGRSVEVLCTGMIELGLLQGSVADCIKNESYKRFYMHRTSHWLGMDVHDVGAYTVDGKSRPLEPGMVITIEPGLYIPADAKDVPDEYRGIGIRIEDDILVTAEGFENLTAHVPKTVADVEAACNC